MSFLREVRKQGVRQGRTAFRRSSVAPLSTVAGRGLFSTDEPPLATETSPDSPSQFQAPELETAPSAPPLARATAFSAGTEVGTFASRRPSEFHAIVNSPEVVEGISKQGYKSGRQRAREAGETVAPSAVPDAPGHGGSGPSDQEIVEYSGVKGARNTFRTSNVVGTKADPAEALETALGTSGFKKKLSAIKEALAQGKAGRIDEVDPRKTLPPLVGRSAEEAFDRVARGRNKYRIVGETGYEKEIPPQAFGHSARVPLRPEVVSERYLRNLAQATETSLENPATFDVTTKEHADLATGQTIPIDTFHRREKPGEKKKTTG